MQWIIQFQTDLIYKTLRDVFSQILLREFTQNRLECVERIIFHSY